MILKLMIMGHFIADFYAQTNRTAKEKKSSPGILLRHCNYYTVILFLSAVLPLTKDEIFSFAICVLIISILHGMIDFLKIRYEKGRNISPGRSIYLFILDQFLHIGIITAMCLLFHITGGEYVTILMQDFELEAYQNIIAMVIGILICGRPASILIQRVFALIIKPECDKRPGAEQTIIKIENPKVGSYIGVLEREIIFFLGVMGQFGAIGFILTAKSVARYKQLEDQKFAEKYLVGTLLSAVIAIACIGVYNYLKIR